MFTYEPSVFVEPLGYQPVEFLDNPQMSESADETGHTERRERYFGGRDRA